jgi:long-chain acyl-CoA synthetase
VDDDLCRHHAAYEDHNYREVRHLVLGGNLRFFVAGGAPLSQEINEFFWCLGTPVYELYGMTETGGATTNLPGAARPGTVGRSWPGENWPGGGGETRLSPEGEIVMRGPNVMVGYLNRPDQTAEALRDGWMHSGDVAAMDADGYFRITDRIKDILITAGGKNIAPSRIESLLKEDPLIGQVMVYGDRMPYLTALITLDPLELQQQAKALGIAGDYAELTRHPLVRQLVQAIVTEKNRSLARYETIKDFILLERDLSIEAGDLTPTLKLKKKQLVARYGPQLDALYR